MWKTLTKRAYKGCAYCGKPVDYFPQYAPENGIIKTYPQHPQFFFC
uniref:Uncharacterized protein n=1 Tax=Coprothermobacter proteolyticus (strain ATCC 35245 / DSM 5265 / OCM 4 / BT) TaxID=309798 RepID=B5Y6N8_COPPD